MEKNHEIYSLREWAPLTEIIEKIPHRVQKGLFPVDLGITCIDVVQEFIALGSDAGIVFWYNRFNGDVQKLRAEVSTPITCVKIVSSVEYMVAAGNASGQVSVFQIQKELPADLNLVAPFTKAKPVERYTIRDLHRCTITCCEWSKNGMKLYSGDKQGVIVLTEFDYQTHLSKSVEILNEAYEIVQLSVHQSHLLVSTLYRSIICQRNSKNNQWKLSQVGKKDRKILADIGGTIFKIDAVPRLICGRPGLRLWLADVDGNVEKTLLFKDALCKTNAAWEIPILNPCRSMTDSIANFRSIDIYLNKYVVTHDETVLYILNLDQLKVEAVATGFRKIIDFCICNKEIFILEGLRSVLRLAPSPEPPNKSAKIIFNPLLPPPVPVLGTSLFESPIEYEAEDEAVINAEECFELPPIEEINLDISIELAVESPRAEQSRRMEIFNQIGEKEFEESILHHRGVNNGTKKEEKPKKKKKTKSEGIVEIGQAIAESGTSDLKGKTPKKQEKPEKPEKPKTLEFTAKPTVMDASFCTDPSSSCSSFIPRSMPKPSSSLPKSLKNFLPEALTPTSLQQAIEIKEKALAEKLHLEPVQLSEISEEELKQSQSELKSQMHSQIQSTTWQYPLKSYPVTQLEDAEVQTTPRKKIHFISDDDCQDECDSASIIHKPLQFIPTQPIGDIESSEMMPTVVKMPDSMRIPSLWNISVENIGDCRGSSPEPTSSHTSSEWEFLDN